MSGSGGSPVAAASSPLGLRAFHLIIFLGFGAAATAGMLSELRQLFEGLAYAWHCGTPPSPLGTAAALAAIGLCLALVGFLALGRSAPLWLSGGILVAFAVSLWQQGYRFERRSAAGANLAMLELGKLLHQTMRDRLQHSGAVATAEPQWAAALQAQAAAHPELASPYRGRFFVNAPWALRILTKEGDFLPDAAPGTYLVFVPSDASHFTLTMVGLDPQHQPVRLRDDQGQPFELKGAFTPDTGQ